MQKRHSKAFRDSYLAAITTVPLLLISFFSDAQIYQRTNNFGTVVNRESPDSAFFFPTGCGTPTDTTWLFSQGFGGKGERLRKWAIFGDSCGHKVYLWDPSAKSWSVIGSGSGADSAIAGINGIIVGIAGTTRYIKSDTFYNSTRARLLKTLDSMVAVNNARYVTNSGGEKFLGSGPYASRPSAGTGPGFYWPTDTLKMMYTDGSAYSFITDKAGQTFGLHIVINGVTGDSLITVVNDSTFSQPRIRDSLNAHHVVNADGSWTFYVALPSGTGYAKYSGTSVTYLTPTELMADLNVFTTTLQGLVPAPGTIAGKFLGDDGGWHTVSGGGGPASGSTSNSDTVTQTSHPFSSVGQTASRSASGWVLGDTINNYDNGVISAIIDANNFVVTTSGSMAWTSGKPIGQIQYQSTTAGAMTATSPVISIPIGTQVSTTRFLVGFPSRPVDFSGTTGGTPGGSNKDVQINNSGAFGNVPGFTADPATHIVTIDTAKDVRELLNAPTNYSALLITLFGDSYTSGVGSTIQFKSWASQFGYLMGLAINNLGVGGTVLEKRTPNNPFGSTPNMIDHIGSIPTYGTTNGYLVIAYGFNDVMYNGANYTGANFKTDYTTVLNAAISDGWPAGKIVLVSPYFATESTYEAYASLTGNPQPNRARTKQFVDTVRSLATSFATQFVDVYTPITQRADSLNLFDPDGIHPSDQYHAWIAQQVFNVVTNSAKNSGHALTVAGTADISNIKLANPKSIPDPTMLLGLDTNRNVRVVDAFAFIPNNARDTASSGAININGRIIAGNRTSLTATLNDPATIIAADASGFGGGFHGGWAQFQGSLPGTLGGAGVEIGKIGSDGYIGAYGRDGSGALNLQINRLGGNVIIHGTDQSTGNLQVNGPFAIHQAAGTYTTFTTDGNGRLVISPTGAATIFAASTTSWPSVIIPAGTFPTSPTQGAFGAETGHLWYRDQSTTYDLLAAGGSSFYQTVQSNASSQTQRAKLNFSTDFTLADNGGNGSTDVTIASTKLSGTTYIPTFTNTTNIASSSVSSCTYSRNGNILTVQISGSITATTASSAIVLNVTLPPGTIVTGGQGNVGAVTFYDGTSTLLVPGIATLGASNTVNFIAIPTNNTHAWTFGTVIQYTL